MPAKRSHHVAPGLYAEAPPRHDHDHDYQALLDGVKNSFASQKGPFFTTDASGLYELYLDNLPSERQVHNCHACRRFIEQYGGLATITPAGHLQSVMWSAEMPEFYAASFIALEDRVCAAKVTGVHLTNQAVWGTPKTGLWRHMAVQPDRSTLYQERSLTAFQRASQVRENYNTVRTALREFPKSILAEALRVLKAEVLARSDKFLAPVQWLHDLHSRPKGRAGDNVLWAAVAVAPEGFCHPRASVVGSLLEDLAAGLPIADVKKRFNLKLAPLAYQRPQAAPAAGNIQAAEALVEKLGIKKSLARRFATVKEVAGQALWEPDAKPKRPRKDGSTVFAHVKPKSAPPVGTARDLPGKTMTWEKFAKTVLPSAMEIEALTPRAGPYVALVTAEHKKAPPILKWDHEDERNPVSWYLYPSGAPASQFNLVPESWVPVNMVLPLPTLWGTRPMPHLFNGAILLLKDCREIRPATNLGLFPEVLKTELHPARATIEAHSRSGRLEPRLDAAAGLLLQAGQQSGLRLRVTEGLGRVIYTIDRWD